ncbi:MAG: DUF6838 family protein [Velocimicrobium sp.]
MINSIKQEIASKLVEHFEGSMIYNDDMLQESTKPAFLITITQQTFSRRLNAKTQSTISFDIAYFSGSPASEISTDCQMVQQELFRIFDCLGNFRVNSRRAKITDHVLHFMFDISYLEVKVQAETTMKSQTINTNL